MPGDTSILLVLRRLIDFSQGNLPPSVAEAVLQLHFSASDEARLTDLADKSTAGTLSAEEAIEYDALIDAADLVSFWKSKARLCLKQTPSAA